MEIQTLPCPKCRQTGVVDVPDAEVAALVLGGGHIQDVMATTPAPIREQIMTGFHPACWDAVMSEPED